MRKSIVLILLLWGSTLSASTLVVTYQSGVNGKRLERIHFLLSDKQSYHQMYPKSDSFNPDSPDNVQMVVVEDLSPGEYTLEFLIPNSDGLFEEVPMRQLSIGKDAVVKVDQVIGVHYATLQVKAIAEGAPTTPSFTLCDTQQQVCAKSTQSELYAAQLLPGHYILQFSDIEGFETPPSQTIILHPDEKIGPLVVAYHTISN